MVFQCLAHTTDLPTSMQRHLSKAHDRRNKAQYEGLFAISDRFVDETIAAARALLDRLQAPHGGT
jgi:hypothetical protein